MKTKIKIQSEKKLQNVMRRMLFDFTYLSCSPLKKKVEKTPEIFRSSSNSPLIIITDVLFWKLVWTKKQELIELWAKINSLRCILTKKSNRKIRQQHCILSPLPSKITKKIQSFSLIFYSCRIRLDFLERKRKSFKKYFMFYQPPIPDHY